MNFQLNEKGIISVVSILTIGLFSLGMIIISLTGTLKETAKNINNKNGEQAFYTAEAAAREGVYQYRNKLPADSYTGGTPEFINQVLSGSISVDDNPLNWPYVYITSDAINKNKRAVIVELNVFPESEVFNYAVYSESNIDLKGTSSVTVFITAITLTSGGSGYISVPSISFSGGGGSGATATATLSPGDIIANGNIIFGGTADICSTCEAVSDGDIPSIQIKYNDLATSAESFNSWSGVTGAKNYLQSVIATDTHIVYINDSEIHQTLAGVNLTGSLIVDASSCAPTADATDCKLIISGGTYTAANNYPAIVVKGNLEVAGGAQIYGVVYVSGTTKLIGNNNKIYGSLISVGSVNLGGNSSIEFDPNIINTWKNLAGLDLNPAIPQKPKISSWREE